jgi:plasmid maintenance system antidote protein VapI
MDGLKVLVGNYAKSEGITKDELAERIGIGRSSLYAKLSGQTPWFLDEAVKLSGLLGITVDELAELASRQ